MQNTASLVGSENPQNKAERLKEGNGNLPQFLEKNSSILLNPQIENLNTLQNSYQQLQKEGIAKISEMIQPNLEKDKEPHLNSFISYLVSNLNDICKDDQQLQEILDNFDLSYEQINQILNVWEDYRVKLIEKKDQIIKIQAKNDQENNNNNQCTNIIERNEGEGIQNDTINALKREIEQLQKQITKQIQPFQEYLMNYLGDKGQTINIDNVNKLLQKLNLYTGQENELEDIDQIMEVFNLTRKQEKEIQSELEKYSQEVLKIKYQIKQKNQQIISINLQTIKSGLDNPYESLIKNFKEQLNQISEKDWTQDYNDILNELINYLKASIEQDQQIQQQTILNIIENVELSRQIEKKVISQINEFVSEYKQLYSTEKSLFKLEGSSSKHNEETMFTEKEIRLDSNQIKFEMQDKQSILQKDKNLSQMYTLAYQLQDYCLDQVSLKVICDFQKIQELMSQLKQDEVKTVALYGDFKLSIKIIQQYYPKAANLINLDQYKPPHYDQLVALTDGSVIFLIFEEQSNTFEGDIFDNEEGQLYIRFLLDTCSIFITCLAEKQVSNWSNINPFEKFEFIVPPKKYKDRSSIHLQKITIKTNQEREGRILLSNDQNNCMIMHKRQLSYIVDQNKLQNYTKIINQNKQQINNLFQGSDLWFQIQFDKIVDQNNYLKQIFKKHTQLSQQIDQIYFNFKDKIFEYQSSVNEKISIQNLQFVQTDYLNAQNKIIIHNSQNLKNKLLDLVCKSCEYETQFKNRKYGCKNCLPYKSMVDYILEEVQNERNFIRKKYYKIIGYSLQEIISSISEDIVLEKNQQNFSLFSKYINCSHFYTHFKGIQSEVLSQLQSLKDYSFYKSAITETLNFIFFITYEFIQKLIQKREEVNYNIQIQKDIYLEEIDQCFKKLQDLQEERIFVDIFQFTYNPIKKEEVLMSMNYKFQNLILNDQAHKLIDYISFDEQVDYVIYNNCYELDKAKQKTSIYMLRKTKQNTDLEPAFSVPGSLDISLFINQYSRQWVIFSNDNKKNSIGKINSDYSFEEGRLDINVYQTQTQKGNIIEKVDSCVILNEKNNVVYLYEKKKKQFYQLFLSGQLKEINFDLSREINNDGVVQLQNIPQDELGDILSVKNFSEGDYYIFQTAKCLYLTNPNYIVKQEILLQENFLSFKLITTDNSNLLITLYQNNIYECHVIQGIEDQEDKLSISSSKEDKSKMGNILIDKMIKSMVHYGSNSTQVGCPGLVHQMFYYEQNQEDEIQNFKKCIEKYFTDCISCKNISFKITHSSENCFDKMDLLLNKLETLLQTVDSIKNSDLQFILQTRIPLQLTTIQQANYFPLKDGLFKQDLMNVPVVEDQIEQIKKQISFGWMENIIQQQNKNIYTIAMCGRQSVGKSSQLNRLFGTRFGVSASRCTDGIWIGLSKLEDRLILVMDCEGLFSIRRSEDEEVKLLLQITSISDITIVFCDIDGINQPFLQLFQKLQICAGKMQSDSYFLGTMVLLTKNVQDEGDKKKLLQESQIHLNKKEIKNTLSMIQKGGLSYGFLKSYSDKDYDQNLQKIRDDLLYKQILLLNKHKDPLSLMNTLKYSMIQIYLNDDQDIDLVSKQAEIKDIYNYFHDLFFDLSNQKFIKSEKLLIQFEYKPISKEEQSMINDKSVFKYDLIFNQNPQNANSQLQEQIDDKVLDKVFHRFSTVQYIKDITLIDQCKKDPLSQQDENVQQNKIYDKIEEREINIDQETKSFNFLELNQCDIKLLPQHSHRAVIHDKKSQNCEQLENIFFSCFRVLQRANFNNYIQQMQNFYNIFIEQRRNTIQEYFNNKMPSELKYREIFQKFEQKFDILIHSLDNQLIICKQKCVTCNRYCVNIQGHKGNCDCETSHKCYFNCQICKNKNECFLISGHEGMHFCKEMSHLCQKPCQISTLCKEICTLEPHQDDTKHSCQGEHKCESQCRLYHKCGKTCSLQSGHQETSHICESTQCYDKCEFCDKLCGFKLHEHDILLSNIDKNKELLMKDGQLVTKHLCGDQHSCLEKCEKPGVCNITYKTEEKIWETKTSKFEYQFIKPCKSQKQCSIQIEPWQTSHKGEHQCESSLTHRCDQQCPECLSYCFENYNHSGNHNSKNHRNKENCLFVSETDHIKIGTESGNIRSYLPGESSMPENCLQSCVRMSRAHVHLRVCKGGDECAQKKYPFARHSTKKYKPFTHLVYDEMLCKSYWNSINWEPPAEQENLQINQLCNVGCSHDSHINQPNYCTKQAWHEGSHQIDPKNCGHLGSGIVDICFTIDTTGSMGWVMSQVSQTVTQIVKKFEGKADIKYSIVSYRDHPPEDDTYVYQIDSQLTDKVTILKVLSSMSANGGGDDPEAVMDGLFRTITEINWRENSQKFIFHICDSPPHGKQFGTESKNPAWTEKGCPCGVNEYNIALLLNQKKIFYYLVKTNSTLNMMEDIFQRLFGPFFKQTIHLEEERKLDVEIVTTLSKEINLSNEFYHVQDNKKL
ncbi:hypothetical protein ABPG74_019668 [Tetrahymena malaccensis]